MTLFTMRSLLLVQFLLLYITILADASGDEPWSFVPGSYIVEFADQLGDVSHHHSLPMNRILILII